MTTTTDPAGTCAVPTSAPPRERPSRTGSSAPRRQRPDPTRTWTTVAVALTAAAILVVGWSYRLAAGGTSPQVYYAVFWSGMLPVWLALARCAASPRVRWGAAHTLLLAVVTWFPKLLRNPYGPLYHDEMAHQRAVRDLLSTGDFFTPNPIIPVIGQYPGLHDTTAVLSGLSGLSPWVAGLTVLAVAHVVVLASVHAAARAVLGPGRAADIATLVYAANPSALYFDNQFAYESLGLPCVTATVALTILAERAAAAGRPWRLRAALAVVAATMCVVTHALSTVFLLAVLALVSLVHVVAGRRLPPAARVASRPWLVVAGATVVLAGAWFAVVARDTVRYLSPYPAAAFDQIVNAARGGGGERTLFVGSVQPAYERYAGYAVQLALGTLMLLVVVRAWRLRTRWRESRTAVALVLLAAAYFPSAVFILAPRGAEGARRSWTFIYLGLAGVVAVGVAGLLVRRGDAQPLGHRAPRAVAAVLVAGLLLVGNASVGLNDPYRFPGPYRFGSDTRDRPPEVRAVSAVLGRGLGDVRVVTDRYTAMTIVGHSPARTVIMSPGYPASRLFLRAADPSPELARMMTTSRDDYAVVDSRVSALLPLAGWYYEPDEPAPGTASQTVPEAGIRRLDTVPWAVRILSSDHYSVYRLDLSQVRR